MAISFGDLFMDKFTDENIHNEDVKKLASKVKVSVGDEWARSYPGKKGATVTIRTHSGKVYSSSVSLPKGEPENPATLKDLMEKFLANSTPVLSPEKSRKLGRNIMELENLSIRDITHFAY
jgi:2-methylcitrate dehydratase PrpD